MRNAIIAILVVSLAVPGALSAATLLVPSQYPTIQSGIDAAVDGDIVIITPGTYTGEGNRDISFKGKPITVRSEDPSDPNVVAATIIDCNADANDPHRGFLFNSSEGPDSVLAGLSIFNNYVVDENNPPLTRQVGGAIFCDGASPTVEKCKLSIMDGSMGVVFCTNSQMNISKCSIEAANVLPNRGIWADSSSITIEGCTIRDCRQGILVAESNAVIGACMIINNSTGVLVAGDSNVVIEQSIVSGGANRLEMGVRTLWDPYATIRISDTNITDVNGTGIAFEGYELSVHKCSISKNHAFGIRASGSRIDINDCAIVGNAARGVLIASSEGAILSNCIIRANVSRGDGGGLYCEGPSTIRNCVISGNTSQEDGGGLYCHGRTEIDNCTISNNIAAGNGGGVYASTDLPYDQAKIVNCKVSGNVSSEYGGGIYASGEVVITECLVAANGIEWYGAGIYGRGNITIEGSRIAGNPGAGVDTVGLIRDSVIVGNGAGIVMWSAPKGGNNVITNCTIVANGEYPGEGALGIYAYKTDINNCIVWGNGTLGGKPAQQIRIDPWYSSIRYSCVEGGFAGEGNIDVEPRFVMPGYWDVNGTPDDASDDFWVDGDYRLRADSPCIDAGDPNFIAGPNETDIDGNPRVLDGDEDGNAVVDMGAYEYIPPIEARVCIMPNVLNLKSNGRWIICLIKLPQPYDVEEIDSNSVFLQEEIGAERVLVIRQTALVFFDRQAVEAVLQPGKVELLITGQLISGREFEGSDTIRVISGPKGPGKRGGCK